MQGRAEQQTAVLQVQQALSGFLLEVEVTSL
jgi:hypothetical protein